MAFIFDLITHSGMVNSRNSRGIYLVANFKSQSLCENLVYSIRQSGCTLPIKLIHFGGERIKSAYILSEADLITATDFSPDGLRFIDRLQSVLTDCPRGYLHRFLAWFGEWDEFLYSDNDIVALMNWEKLFDFLPTNYLVHSDEEYLTEGRFNYDKPQSVREIFGQDALSKAFTAGHYVSTKNSQIIADIDRAIEWFKTNPDIPKKHDQALLHIASLLGNWNVLNLCKAPNHWLTTWASDYQNNLTIIQAIQAGQPERKISHLHYSGRNPDGTQPVDDLLFSNLRQTQRLNRLMVSALQNLVHLDYLRFQRKRVKRAINKLIR